MIKKDTSNNILTKLLEYSYYKNSFYESGWCLYYILNNVGQFDRHGISSHSRIFYNNLETSRKFRKIYGYDSPIDETVSISSNILNSNVYSYLWGAEGQNVYIDPDEDLDYDEALKADFKLKKAITDDKHFNTAIRVSLKNCIDYGVGYIFTDTNFYKPIHPLSIQKCVIGKESCYIYEQQIEKSYIHNDQEYGKKHNKIIYVFGENGKFSEMLGIKENSPYFMIKMHIKEDGTPEVEKHKTSNLQFIHELSLPYYEDELGMSIGCGMKSLDSAIALMELTRHAKKSQEQELDPYAIITSTIDLKGRNGLAAGTFHTINEFDLEGTPPVMYPSTPRATNSAGYIEFWRNNIRACYVLGSIMNVGRGQTTEIEATTNYSSISAMIKGLIRPFDWFILPLIKRFIINNKTELQKDISLNYSKTNIILLGGVRSSDIIERVSSMLQSIQGVASIAMSIDQSSAIMFRTPAIIKGVLGNELPKQFLATNQQYQEAVDTAIQLTQQQLQQGQ